MAFKLPLGYIIAFLPSDSQILEIGRLVIEENAPEYAEMVQRIDMYDSTFEERLAGVYPAIKVKNQFLVITSRTPNAQANGFSRGVSGSSGDYWYPRGAVEVKNPGGLEEVLGYYRDLVLYRGGKGGKGGENTQWTMREFYTSSKTEKDQVICTVSLQDEAAKKDLLALKRGLEAAKSLKEKAVAPRNIKMPLEPIVATDRGKSILSDAAKGKPLLGEEELCHVGAKTNGKKGVCIKDNSEEGKIEQKGSSSTESLFMDAAESRVTRSQTRKKFGEVNDAYKEKYGECLRDELDKGKKNVGSGTMAAGANGKLVMREDEPLGAKSKSKGKMVLTEEEPVSLGYIGVNKGKENKGIFITDVDRGKVYGADSRVTRSQSRLKVPEVNGRKKVIYDTLRSHEIDKCFQRAVDRRPVISSEDDSEDDSDDDSEDDSEGDSDDDSEDDSEFGEDDGENDSEVGEDSSESEGEDDSVNGGDVGEDDGEDQPDYVDSVEGSVYCTVCNPPTEGTRGRVEVNTSEANDMTTTCYYNQE